MFTLSKMSPDLEFGSDAHEILGSKLSKPGSRILLLCSLNPDDRLSISRIKDALTKNGIIFIQYDQSGNFINKDDLDKLYIKAETFNVTDIIALGDSIQRMSGRFISQSLSLNYIEIPTVLNNSYLLVPQTIYSNRIGNDYMIHQISPERIKSIYIYTDLLRNMDKIDIALEVLSLLLDLTHLFTSKKNNIISIEESRNLFDRILIDMENDEINVKKLSVYSLTAAMYHGASSNIELTFTLYSWIAGYRFKFNSKIACAKLLPYFLEDSNELEWSIRVRELLDRFKISSRLTDIGFTLNQLLDISKDRPEIEKIIKKAF